MCHVESNLTAVPFRIVHFWFKKKNWVLFCLVFVAFLLLFVAFFVFVALFCFVMLCYPQGVQLFLLVFLVVLRPRDIADHIRKNGH